MITFWFILSVIMLLISYWIWSHIYSYNPAWENHKRVYIKEERIKAQLWVYILYIILLFIPIINVVIFIVFLALILNIDDNDFRFFLENDYISKIIKYLTKEV